MASVTGRQQRTMHGEIEDGQAFQSFEGDSGSLYIILKELGASTEGF